MKKSSIVVNGVAVAIVLAIAVPALSETQIPIEGPPEVKGGPGWYRMGSKADPEGEVPLSRLVGKGELGNSSYGRRILGPRPAAPGAPTGPGFGGGAPAGEGGGPGGGGRADTNRPDGGRPGCSKTVVCYMDGTQLGGVSEGVERIVWRQTLGYTFEYPFEKFMPTKNGQIAGAGTDSKGNIWAVQRAPAGEVALYKFSPGPDHKLLIAVPPSVTDHAGAAFHGLRVDPFDNVWVTQQGNSIVQKFSPEGKLLQTIGQRARRGDWDEAKGQRLLWEPVSIDFNPNGEIYIFNGHEDESPNDVGNPDPANRLGSPRVIHLDKDGKFINQWFGNDFGPGKFFNTHGGAVDPVTGDVWVGDRQNYRIVIFTANGRFIRTIQMRNLTSAIFFDNRKGPTYGQVWLATGQDAQVLKLNRDGKVLGAIGSRKDERPEGRAFGQTDNHFGEAAYMGVDKDGNFYVGDTINTRVAKLVPPKGKK